MSFIRALLLGLTVAHSAGAKNSSPVSTTTEPHKVLLKNGDSITLQDSSWIEPNSKAPRKVEIKLFKKNQNAAIILFSAEGREVGYILRDTGDIEAQSNLGGSLMETASTLWRVEKDRLRLISEESTALDNSSRTDQSTTVPHKVVVSVDYIAGTIIETSEFYNRKSKKNCTFKAADYVDYEFSKRKGVGPGLTCVQLIK